MRHAIKTMLGPIVSRRAAHLTRVMLLVMLTSSVSACGGCVEENDNSANIFDEHPYGEWEYDGQPDIDGPQRVVMGDLAEGETAQKTVSVTNVGREVLKLAGWELDGPFQFSFPAYHGNPPRELVPGESIEATITYFAHTTERTEGLLTVQSNDPDERFFEIALYANADFPCLELTPDDELDFGVSEIDQQSTRYIEAKSCADRTTTTFRVDAVEGADEFSLLDDTFRDEVVLAAGESIRIPIGFVAGAPETYEGSVKLVTNDDLAPERVVYLTGQGEPYDCPQPVILASSPGRGRAIADPEGQLNAVPLDTVNLDASRSRDPENSGIARVRWRIARRPPDSTSGIENADRTNASIWMQLAGTYVVELDVWNELGVKSCEPARMTLRSVANEDIHVQLVWHTPDDPDETDGSGSDVDLHFLHPNANEQWNMAPWDCFWTNKTPDWGRPRERSDDPSLDIDDTDGAGPENINLDNPENGDNYHVGVYYYSDHNYDTSYATIRVYIGGQLALESQRQRMRNHEFWDVATIGWPGGNIQEIDRLYPAFP